VLAVLSLWPSGPLQHSLLANRGSLRAISVIRHPTLRHFLHVEAFCAVGVVLSILVPLSLVFCFARSDRYALVKGLLITEHRGEAGRPRLSDTGRTDAHNASLVPWLTLRHGQGDEFSLLSSFLCRSPSFANRAGCSREIVKSRVESRVLQRLDDGFSLYPTDNVFTNKGLTGSLSLSSSLFLTLSHSL